MGHATRDLSTEPRVDSAGRGAVHEHRRLALAALFGGAICIGFAPIFVRASEIGPSAKAFYRLLFALPVVWSWFAWEKRRNPATRKPGTRREFLLLAVAGLFFAGDMAMWHWSLRYTSVANSTLLTNFAPIFVTLGAWFLLRERIRSIFVWGMMVALSGAVLLIGASFTLSRENFLGDVLSVVTALLYAGYQLSVKNLRRYFAPLTIMAWSGLVSCPALLLIALVSGDKLWPASAAGWMVLVGLALVSHVGGQTLITYAFGHLPASFSSLGLLLQPVIAAVLAWVLLREPLTAIQFLGGGIVLAGIALASRATPAAEG